VPDLRTLDPIILSVLASGAALDALTADDTHRVAADEAMIVTDDPTRAAGVAVAVAGVDADALVVDATDGWSAVRLIGPGARATFARCSHLELPDDGFVQGDVEHIPVRIIVVGERIDLFVPAMWEHYLRQRLLAQGVGEANA
jgi:sarcosine oxidase gamma subunit